MILYPAVDILGGKCVRLEQGDFERATEYAGDPAEQARTWEALGASFIHVVDLDGARGTGGNDGVIASIIRAVSVPIQVGGGARSMGDIERRLSSGVSRVILGTAAVRNPGLVRDAVREFDGRVAVGVDSKNGRVAVSGWSEVSSVAAEDLCVRMRDAGVSVVIHTDIASDGMMRGPDLESAGRIIALGGLNVIVSGGVASMDDLRAAREIGAGGVIIGRALYRGSISLAEAVKIFEGGRDETC